MPYRSVFEPLDVFNAVQSEVMDDVLYSGTFNLQSRFDRSCSELQSVSDNHIIVSAPTGSGKTTILELAIVQLLIHLESISYKIDGDGKNIKIVYGKYRMEFA